MLHTLLIFAVVFFQFFFFCSANEYAIMLWLAENEKIAGETRNVSFPPSWRALVVWIVICAMLCASASSARSRKRAKKKRWLRSAIMQCSSSSARSTFFLLCRTLLVVRSLISYKVELWFSLRICRMSGAQTDPAGELEANSHWVSAALFFVGHRCVELTSKHR